MATRPPACRSIAPAVSSNWLPAVAVAGREDRAVARRDPPVVDGADVTGRRPDARLLRPERREREQARPADQEIGVRPLIQESALR